MPGQYNKNDFLIRGLKRKYPYDELEMVLKKPKFYNDSTLGLPPSMSTWVKSKNTQTATESENVFGNARDKSNTLGYVNTGMSVGSAIASHASDAVNVAREVGIGVGPTLSGVASAASEFGKAAGPIIGAAGAVMSGVSLGLDIANAKKAGKVTFDNAMHIADDATGIVSGIASSLPGPGTAIGIGLTVGEKIVTAPFKAYHAVKEEEKREGVKHLSPNQWLSTVVGEFTPKWWQLQIGSKEWKQYWKDDKAKRKIASEEKKKQDAANKAERKRIWKSGTAKEKARDFFFG
ncbi:hypothetical protein FACS189472_11440 [Alphaproteobacteria bacterium]|nr:hypothetical protein FACS189472_11440 [Alphaproteobacteria bacterium]